MRKAPKQLIWTDAGRPGRAVALRTTLKPQDADDDEDGRSGLAPSETVEAVPRHRFGRDSHAGDRLGH